jgi:CelD/BcsL family acetyltransferase involved in cellulose biosynthesis
MRVDISRPDELRGAEVAAWHSMQRATPSLARPFLSPEFTIAVGRFRPSVQVAILTDGPSIIGFFPFERRRLAVGVPICGLPGTFYQGVICAPKAEWHARELLRQCRLSAWQFDHLIAAQRPFIRYHTATEPLPVIDLSDGYESYYDKLKANSPHFCTKIARQMRNLARDVGDLRYVADTHDVSLLRTLMGWKSEQCRRKGWTYPFGQPWATGLLDTLLATTNHHASGLLSVCYAGDQPVAAQFGLRYKNLLAGWFTAYDPRFAKYSPGVIQFMQLAKALPELGIHFVELGEGAEAFKQKMKSYEYSTAQGIVTSGSASGTAQRARYRSVQLVGKALHKHPRLRRVTGLIRNPLQ